MNLAQFFDQFWGATWRKNPVWFEVQIDKIKENIWPGWTLFSRIYDHQLGVLKKHKCPDEIIDNLMTQKQGIYEALCQLTPIPGSCHFLPVIPAKCLDLRKQMKMVRFANCSGEVDPNCSQDYKQASDVPDQPYYVLGLDVHQDLRHRMLDLSIALNRFHHEQDSEGISWLKGIDDQTILRSVMLCHELSGAKPITACEGIAMGIHSQDSFFLGNGAKIHCLGSIIEVNGQTDPVEISKGYPVKCCLEDFGFDRDNVSGDETIMVKHMTNWLASINFVRDDAAVLGGMMTSLDPGDYFPSCQVRVAG